MSINERRLWRRIEALSRITDPDRPWTRRSFGPLFAAGRAWLANEFRQASLNVTIDPAGNLIGELRGRSEDRKPIVLGSHSDTVPSGGRFDGVLGLLAALEVAQSFGENGIALVHPLQVIDFLAEEPSEYGISCVGSRAIAGALDEDALDLRAADGEALRDAMVRVGGAPDRLESVRRAYGNTAAFLELHIEQGPVLESENVAIGVVTDIVGIHRSKIVIEGMAGHAGTVPMHRRQDALVGAAHVIETAYRSATKATRDDRYVVATIGNLSLWPNAINAVPGRVELILEVRSSSEAVLSTFADSLVRDTTERIETLQLSLIATPLSFGAPTSCALLVQQAIGAAAHRLGLTSRPMSSGAGHDAVYMAATGPMGMIFVPCAGGHSHCPDEYVEPVHAANGTRVMYEAVIELDRMLTSSWKAENEHA